MIKLGITGGIGSGKSIVANLLQIHGVPVYIADVESKRLTASSPLIREKLVDMFGEKLYLGNKLDRKLLASYIFTNPDYLQQVNAIIHPVVYQDFQEWAARQGCPVCGIESAILFESGFHQIVDKTIMVYAPLPLRMARAMSRDNVSREEIQRRIENQLSDEVKKERADYIIHNDDRHALLPQIKNLLTSLE